jgi:serine/threonine-protein kinase
VKSGRPPAAPGRRELEEAARRAQREGRVEEAARLFHRAERHYEAGLAYLHAGDKVRALDSLIHVAPDAPDYRAASLKAVAVALELDVLSIALDQFLARFLAGGPQDDEEAECFYQLGDHYGRHGFTDQSREVFECLTAVRPGYRDTAARLGGIDSDQRAARLGARRILDDEVSFHRRIETRVPAAPGAPPPPEAPRSPTVPSPVAAGAYPFEVGALVGGRYHISRQIGRGGMSIVYQATDVELGEEIALKTFVEETYTDEAQTRLRREMQLSRRLVHPNVLRLYDLGFHDGHRYITMELLVGLELRKRMTAPLPASTVIDYLTQCCLGLQAAHDLGTIHRDVKPENLFVTLDGVLKVMDFGIAKVRSAPNVTLSGVIWGTPKYIAPEQIDNFSSVTPAADLYSVGIVGYEMLTGQAPFDHPELTYLLAMHLRQAPTPLRELRPDVPEAVEAAILKLLAKDPAQRFESCRELAGELEAIRKRLPAEDGGA